MPLTKQDIKSVALLAVNILSKKGYNCCLFGSVACAAYGMNNRVPNDVDIVVLTSDDKEAIKRMIVEADSKFYLLRPKNPLDTYRVLWYRLRPGLSCKVDILLPGLINIPDIPPSLIEIRNDLPVMPFLPLLLLKLHGWSEHMNDTRPHVQVKLPEDRRDLDELLAMVNDAHRLSVHDWLSSAFVEKSRIHVSAFVAHRAYTKESWKVIGFDV